MRTADDARRFIAESTTFWWQRIELAPGVWTPGHDHISVLLAASGLPSDLSGHSVLDVGAANGAVAFTLERRGAARVVAVDVDSGTDFGLERTRDFLGSSVEFVRASVYELPEVMQERFDVVIFFGVLYHLRHPLLALDNIHRLTDANGVALIETAVADAELGACAERSVAAFYPGNELAGDATNWFAPTVRCLHGWCTSSGFSLEVLNLSPPTGAPERCLARARPLPTPPPYRLISYERPLRAIVE